METLTKFIEVKIGEIYYQMDIEMIYDEKVDNGDYWTPPSSDIDIISKEITSEITAWKAGGDCYTVTDPKEEKMVFDWIDWEDILNDNI